MNPVPLCPRILGGLRTGALLSLLTMMAAVYSLGQTFTVLHSFTGTVDGGRPSAGVTLDAAGNLYGTAAMGGYFGTGRQCSQTGCGLAFKMKRSGSGWTLSPLYDFHFDDGVGPGSQLVFGPDGAIYGTTFEGGNNSSLGVVYSLRPPSSFCHAVSCLWSESVLWRFNGDPDGALPGSGGLYFDAAGNFYGTTISGGSNGPYGTVYQMSHTGGSWSENIQYSFTPTKGHEPDAGVIFDAAGNIYVTTAEGPNSNQCGTVSQLVPSGSGWTENVLHIFSCFSYSYPQAGLIMDHAGNLYGSVSSSGDTEGGGALFELTAASGYQTFILLYAFDGYGGPMARLTMDAAGNLYGTTFRDGPYGAGNVFRLTPSNGGWIYTSLHDFTGGSDGGWPTSEVSIDANGNLYGTASIGGSSNFCNFGCGVVWEITP